MLLAALATGVTGYMSLKEVGGESPEEIHEVCANVWLGLVIVHIAGVVIGSSIHRENLVRAMITGYKQGVPGVFRASPAARNASSACSTRYSGWSRPAPLRVRSIVRMRYLPPARLFPDPAWRAHIPSPAWRTTSYRHPSNRRPTHSGNRSRDSGQQRLRPSQLPCWLPSAA